MKKLTKVFLLALATALLGSVMILPAAASEDVQEPFASSEQLPRESTPDSGARARYQPEGTTYGTNFREAPGLHGDVRIPRLEVPTPDMEIQEVAEANEPATPHTPAPNTGNASSPLWILAALPLTAAALLIPRRKAE